MLYRRALPIFLPTIALPTILATTLASIAIADTPAPSESSANIAKPATSNTSIIDYLDAIATEEAQRGAYDPQLGELFHGLASAHQRAGNHKEAITAFKHAMHVNRVNNGIYSVSQEPMLRGMIASHQATAQMESAALNYHRLLGLYERNYGNSAPELIPLLAEASNWHRNVYIEKQSRDRVGHLILAQSMSGSAVDIATRHFGYTHLQLVRLLRDMAESSYYLAVHYGRYETLETPDTSGFFATGYDRYPGASRPQGISTEQRLYYNGYSGGRRAYERIVAILDSNEASPKERAQAYLELGDWFTLFKRRGSAADAYRKGWQALANADQQDAIIELMGKPKMLPVFEFESSDQSESDSDTTTEKSELPHALVSLTVTANGAPRNIRVLKTEPESEQIASRAIRTTRNARFRAQIKDGQPVTTDNYELKIFIAN